MTQWELARKVLGLIVDTEIPVSVYASEGGKCSESWSDVAYYGISRGELLYMIKSRVSDDTIFEGEQLQDKTMTEIEDELSVITMEMAWPDGGPAGHAEDCVPLELRSLADEIDRTDLSDDDAVAQLKDILSSVDDGSYTFYFGVSAGCCCFAEHIECELDCTRDEVLSLLRSGVRNPGIIDGVCESVLDEGYLEGRVRDEGVLDPDRYDHFLYDAETQTVELYVEAWTDIINAALVGELTEDELGVALEYFSEKVYRDDYCFKDWWEDKKS